MTVRVLIVDDSLTVRMDLTEAFTNAGYEVVGCKSAAEMRAHVPRETFGLVLLDVILPDGDGIDLLGELRANKATKNVPVVLLSTEAEVGARIRGLSHGADAYVGKPYDIKSLLARARELLRRKGSSDTGGDQARILVIDDSTTFREALRHALEAVGYRVFTASSGEEGLEVADEVRPSAIVVDGEMPGIDGPTMIRRLRLDTALRRTPCILLTASEDGSGEIGALRAGADAFVRKEEDTSLVLARLAAILRSAPADPTGFVASSLGPKKILVVEDDKTYRDEVSTLLRDEGYEVVCAKTGEEALDLLVVEPVDCILLDFSMPGIGGKETCQRVKSAPHVGDTPLIILSDNDHRDTMLEALGAGADDYVVKTSDSHALRARVDALIRRRQFEDETRRAREQLLRTELKAAEARAARELADTRARLLEELRRKNDELEAFSYSVSHDLRAPLRTIDGFSRAVLEDYSDKLDEVARGYLERVCDGATRMNQLIEDLLSLSRVTRMELRRTKLDLGSLAQQTVDRLRQAAPDRTTEVVVAEGMIVDGDPGLLGIVYDNLIGNAWKFTSKRENARIEIGRDGDAFFVRDNGAGFDPLYAKKLFQVFQRLHSTSEFEGTGIGLATVHRIIDRHGGRVWAEGKTGQGATFYFTLKAS